MKAYVILYHDARLNTHRVSQKAYKTLGEAQKFCRDRLGVDEYPTNPALYQQLGEHVFGNSVTKEQYIIVEVTV